MKSILITMMLAWIFFLPVVKAQEQTVPYTLADRDRSIRMETKMDVQYNSIQKQFENTQKQIDQLSAMFYWGFGILITLFLFNLGYTIWDRRTAIRPAGLR